MTAARLSTDEPDFEPRFRALLAAKRESSEDVGRAAAAIVADVRERGDEALIDLTRRFDGWTPSSPAALRVSEEEIESAAASLAPELVEALAFAHSRILDHHRRQVPENSRRTDALGVEIGARWNAVEAAGLYVPGGAAAYPSSALMTAIPAKAAGVPRIVMTAPTPNGILNASVLAAARLAGVDEVYRVGGAQAVAALAYGTETIRPVAKIVGPGNAYVAAAKRQVFGDVGIDMIAGPSEVLIIADGNNDPAWIAADLLAQAEHDEAAQSLLMTDDPHFAEAVAAAVESQLRRLPRSAVAGASWRDNGAIILVRSLAEAPALADRIAPEHLQIATDDPDALADRIRNVGAIFLGRHTPEAIGDYVAGTNHVLPTARSARFSSGLSALDFMTRTSLLKVGVEGLRALAPATVALARAEGLDGHARSVTIRLNLPD